MRADRGSVTAEFAAALPAVVLLLGMALAALSLASRAVLLQDAAGLAARAMARGEEAPAVAAMAAALSPGAVVERQERSGLVCAVVSGRSAGLLAGIELTAESCALAEG